MTDLLDRGPDGQQQPTGTSPALPTRGTDTRTEPEASGAHGTASFRTNDPDGTSARQAGEHARAAVAIVDRTFHLAALLARCAFYLLLSGLCERVSFGSHLVAGLLLGDFLAAVGIAAKGWRQAPQATFSQLGLFAVLLAYWWSGYTWPKNAEFEALLLLTAFGTAAGRLGAHARRSMSMQGWH